MLTVAEAKPSPPAAGTAARWSRQATTSRLTTAKPVVAVSGVEVVAEPGQVQGDLVGDLGRAHAADGGVEVPTGPVFDRVGGGEAAGRERRNLS